jgi:hypothetical protein
VLRRKLLGHFAAARLSIRSFAASCPSSSLRLVRLLEPMLSHPDAELTTKT